MPRTLEQVQADIDALRALQAQGVQSTSFADRSVQYRSAKEIDIAISVLESEKTSLSNTPRPKHFYAWAGKGM
jgi:hypothetical protein